MLNHATTELFFDNLEVPASNLIGQEGKGFRYILDGMNAERKFRETRLYQAAPISTNLILSHVGAHVLGLPNPSSLARRSAWEFAK
jgi:alkylation response protein AidB-like acyl-CoA dehydrogenase